MTNSPVEQFVVFHQFVLNQDFVILSAQSVSDQVGIDSVVLDDGKQYQVAELVVSIASVGCKSVVGRIEVVDNWVVDYHCFLVDKMIGTVIGLDRTTVAGKLGAVRSSLLLILLFAGVSLRIAVSSVEITCARSMPAEMVLELTLRTQSERQAVN